MTPAGRLALPLVAFLFGVVALGIAVFLVLRPENRTAGGVGGPFSLQGTNGQVVTEKALLGSPSLIFFGFTHCPDVCPTALQEITQVYDAMGSKGDKVTTYFITVDPERDTIPVLKDYLTSFDKRIVGLTGDPAAVEATTKAFRAYAKKVPLKDGGYTMDHTALVYLMDGKGRFVGSLNLDRPPADAAKDVEKLL
jgi:protein SCO1/2